VMFEGSSILNHVKTGKVRALASTGRKRAQATPDLPTVSEAGFVTKTTPYGAAPPVNPMLLALASGATFVARSFSGDIDHLSDTIKKGINHRGFALIDIFQPCVSFNHKNTFAWYRERVYKLENEKGYDTGDKEAALKKSQEWGDRIPIGVIYETAMPTYEDQIPALKKGPLVRQEADPKRVGSLFAEFK